MSAAGRSPGHGDREGSTSSSHPSSNGLRRCVICSGLSLFKRSSSAPAAHGALGPSPPDRSFTCIGRERLAYVLALPPVHFCNTLCRYVQSLPADDGRLDRPDVTFMWCLGKSVFLLQSGMPGLTHATDKEKDGRHWVVTSSSEVPISYRGISQSLSVEYPAATPHRAAPPDALQHSDREALAVPSFADVKPYFKEAGSMLWEGAFTPQSHRHAAAVMSASLLSWGAHAHALRMLQDGHDAACKILHKTFDKWFGSGGS